MNYIPVSAADFRSSAGQPVFPHQLPPAFLDGPMSTGAERAAWETALDESITATNTYAKALRDWHEGNPIGDFADRASRAHAQKVALREIEAASDAAARAGNAAVKRYHAATTAAFAKPETITSIRQAWLDADADAVEALRQLEDSIRRREGLHHALRLRPESSRNPGRGHWSFHGGFDAPKDGLDSRIAAIREVVDVAPRDLVAEATR
ncbi:hypothetical protein ABEG17_02375 [Pedococcus sp. KACC 23699]|uniref:Uncharacterized protein n=1 Tax=Pedococcus sp. KACC 23699 TaxID=3149228 RepID=A0AAU7JUU3_9MICO